MQRLKASWPAVLGVVVSLIGASITCYVTVHIMLATLTVRMSATEKNVSDSIAKRERMYEKMDMVDSSLAVKEAGLEAAFKSIDERLNRIETSLNGLISRK